MVSGEKIQIINCTVFLFRPGLMSANPKGNPGASFAVCPAVKSIGKTIVSIVETTTYEKGRGNDNKTSYLKYSYTAEQI